MPTYRFTSPEGTVVAVVDDDGISRSSMFASAVPPGQAIDPYAAPSVTVSEQRARLLADLSAEYERRMQVIAGGYPSSERESWHVQTAEARALLADAQASTPWIDGAAEARQIDRHELAQRIVGKDAAYRSVHGLLTGTRQRIEDTIIAAGDDTQALNLIDVLAGWPEM